jgi:multiple sugar transport system ATP-binding protein
MTLGDKIVVMHEGHIQQAGSPLDLYQQPCNLFVAGFIGSPKMNFMAGEVLEAHANGVTVLLNSGETVRAAVDGSGMQAGAKVTLGLRAEHISESRSGSEVFTGEVSVVEHLGEANYIYVSREGREDVVIRGDGERHVAPGQSITFSAESTAFHVFDETGQARRRLRPGNMVSASRSLRSA